MIVNVEIYLEFAVAFNGGWLTRTKDGDIFVIWCSGKTQLIETGYSISYDYINKMPIVVGYKNKYTWRPEPPKKLAKYHRNIHRDYQSGGDSKGEFIVIPGRDFQSNYNYYNNTAYKSNKESFEELHTLLIVVDNTAKTLKLDLIIEKTVLSNDCQTILAFGSEGFVILDNPLV